MTRKSRAGRLLTLFIIGVASIPFWYELLVLQGNPPDIVMIASGIGLALLASILYFRWRKELIKDRTDDTNAK
jgi:hypothetical protein